MQPKAIGSYVVGNPLASASFGDVLRGIPLEGEAALCFLQLLPESLSRSPEARSLLQRTTKQWMSVKDLHAVGLLGSGEADGRLYLVYEYLQGRLLSDILERCQQEGLPLSGDQAVYLCERLAGALLSVSSAGTAFGCLAPERVLVTFEGEVKLLPGVFRDLHTTPASTDPCLLPYHRYLPPNLASDRAVRPSADRYALGALMFELLCREPLRPTPGPFDPAARLDEIRSRAGGMDLLPDPLSAIIQKACVTDYPGGYDDLAAMKSDLDQLISSGEYSPTTFNIAFLMHTLFRGEDEEDAAADQAFQTLDRTPFKPAPEPPKPVTVPSVPPPPVRLPTPAHPSDEAPSFGMEPEPDRKGLFIGIGAAGVVLLVAVLAYFAFFRTTGPSPAEKAAQQELAKLQQEQQAMSVKLKALEDEKAQLAAQVENAKTTEEKQKAQKALEEAQKRLQAQKDEQKKLAATTAAAPPAPAPKEVAVPAPAKTEPAPPTAAPSPVLAGAGPSAAPAESLPAPAAQESKVKAGDFVDLWGVDVKPKQLNQLKVDTPSAARQNRATGTIYVEVNIDESGRVTSAKAVKGLPTDFGMNRACEEAAMKLRYSPAISAGVPVKTKMTFPILVK